MLLYLLRNKIEDVIRDEKNRRYDEEQACKKQKALPIMNDLCRAELQRIAKNPAIDKIYRLLFEGQLPVTRVAIRDHCVTAFYNNGTSKEVEFKTLGLVSLTRNKDIFLNNPSMPSGINWSGYEWDIKPAIDKYPYLYFCGIWYFGKGPKTIFFNERWAVGYLLAEKTGLPYIKPGDQPTSFDETVHYFVFSANEKVLKSW